MGLVTVCFSALRVSQLKFTQLQIQFARLSAPQGLVSLELKLPSRIPILYVILGVLVLISVVPMYFYAARVEAINRDRLITNERLLQNTVTRSLADDIAQH